LHDLAKIYHSGFPCTTADVFAHPLYDLRAAPRRIVDHAQVKALVLSSIGPRLQHCCGLGDGVQHVIEVVRDPGSHLPNR
jgi:hypothetical protein